MRPSVCTRNRAWTPPSLRSLPCQCPPAAINTGKHSRTLSKVKVKANVMSICIAPIHDTSLNALRYSTHCQGITQSYMHTLRFIHKWNEPYLPLPPQPQLVLINRPRRDGRPSRARSLQAEIRTCNLPTTSPALNHTATIAHLTGLFIHGEWRRVRPRPILVH